jgi:hypothetical protein
VLPQPRTPRERVRSVRAGGAAPLEAVPTAPPSSVALTRTSQGWAVVTPGGSHPVHDPVSDLVEGLTLADLVLEESGWLPEPDRSARRSARGAVTPADSPAEALDPRAERIEALERTVAQLEHALAARVATERAIGMLAERHGVQPRQAFDGLRAEARRQGRAVQEVAREVLEGRADPAPRQDAPARRSRSSRQGGYAPTADGRS